LPKEIIKQVKDQKMELVEELTVPSMDLKSAIKEFSKSKVIDWLQIDTEGLDDQIIYNSDIDIFNPSIISYEHVHFNKEQKEII